MLDIIFQTAELITSSLVSNYSYVVSPLLTYSENCVLRDYILLVLIKLVYENAGSSRPSVYQTTNCAKKKKQ